MKKILLACVILALSVGTAGAELNVGDILKDIPMQQGFVYSIKDSEFAHATSAVIMSKGEFGIEAGYIDNGKILASLSYTLVNLKDYVDIPVVKELFLRPGLYVGFDEIDTGEPRVDYGVSFTCFKVSF